MKFETFQKRYKENIYKDGDIFWVCDVRTNSNNIFEQYNRKLKPTQVMCLTKETKKKGKEICFYKLKKDRTPSKLTISIYGPTFAAEPFQIFETKDDAEVEYANKLKGVFLEINRNFDNYKKMCALELGNILSELRQF